MPDDRPTEFVPLREQIAARRAAARAIAPVRPRASPERPRRLVHYIYFIGADTGLVKIGMSHDPEARLAHFQAGCPVPLRILAQVEGYFEMEAAYHRRFASIRAHGEWFERHPDVVAEIDRLNATPTPRTTP